jgi:hypothetical protein
MDVQLHHAGIQLDAKRHFTLKDARGTRVLCLAGELWLTQDRDTADHILGPGDSFEIGVDGAVVVHGLHASRLLLLEFAARPRVSRARARRIDGKPPLAVLFHGA